MIENTKYRRCKILYPALIYSLLPAQCSLQDGFQILCFWKAPSETLPSHFDSHVPFQIVEWHLACAGLTPEWLQEPRGSCFKTCKPANPVWGVTAVVNAFANRLGFNAREPKRSSQNCNEVCSWKIIEVNLKLLQESPEMVQRVAAVHSKRAKMFARFKARTRPQWSSLKQMWGLIRCGNERRTLPTCLQDSTPVITSKIYRMSDPLWKQQSAKWHDQLCFNREQKYFAKWEVDFSDSPSFTFEQNQTSKKVRG